VDWSTLGCGRYGHATYAPDEPGLRAQLSAVTAGGQAWRCLRCGSYVPGPPDGGGPAEQAPAVLQGAQIRSRLILRIFAIERFVRALIFFAASYLLWRFRSSQNSIERAFNRELPVLRGLFRELGFDIDHSKLVGLLRHALTLSSHTLTLVAAGAALYAAIEVVEAVGLWQGRRWGEYFAMVATSLGLPLEIYDLTRSVTWLALALLAVNLLLVLYLAISKRLFGLRGGKRAYDARLREESVMEAAIEAASGEAAVSPPGVGAGAAPPTDSAAAGTGPAAADPATDSTTAGTGPAAADPATDSTTAGTDQAAADPATDSTTADPRGSATADSAGHGAMTSSAADGAPPNGATLTGARLSAGDQPVPADERGSQR
jgi:uncharacterized membrane protein (DUF2068 family)